MRLTYIVLCSLLASGSAMAQDIPPPPPVKDLSPSALSEEQLQEAKPKKISLEEAMKKNPTFIKVEELPPVGDEGVENPEDLVDPNNVEVGENFTPKNLSTISLYGIHKLTGRSELLTGSKGDVIRFDRLEITLHQCSSVLDQGEQGYAALIEVKESVDTRSDGALFRGWLFSTSPSLSSIGHPEYDLLLKECTKAKPKPKKEKQEGETKSE